MSYFSHVRRSMLTLVFIVQFMLLLISCGGGHHSSNGAVAGAPTPAPTPTATPGLTPTPVPTQPPGSTPVSTFPTPTQPTPVQVTPTPSGSGIAGNTFNNQPGATPVGGQSQLPTPVIATPIPLPSDQGPGESNPGLPIVSQPQPIIIAPSVPPISSCSFGSCNGSIANTLQPGTKDVNLQRGEAEAAKAAESAETLATYAQMDFESARQLTVLAQRMSFLENHNQLTDHDRVALADSALEVAGVAPDEVSNAVASAANGDKRSVDQLMERAANHLGMPSSAILRDEILPSLGIAVP